MSISGAYCAICSGGKWTQAFCRGTRMLWAAWWRQSAMATLPNIFSFRKEGKLFHRDALFEVFEPVEDEVDLLKGLTAGLELLRREQHEKSLAVRSDIEIVQIVAHKEIVDGKRRRFADQKARLRLDIDRRQPATTSLSRDVST